MSTTRTPRPPSRKPPSPSRQKPNPPTPSRRPRKPRKQSRWKRKWRTGDFASLLAGGFTRQELEQLLAYGPETLDEQGIEGMDLLLTVNAMCQSCEDLPPETQYIGYLATMPSM